MNKYFTQRGNKTTPIEFNDEILNITIKVPSNKDHDEMMEKYSEVGADGMMITHGADFIEDRLIKFIIDLPFEVPINEEMTEFKSWINCDESEKNVAINCMDSKLRDIINNLISGIEMVTGEESGN